MSWSWIGVDLDGTLAMTCDHYGNCNIGEPVPAMLARVKEWLAEGKDVRILTARVAEFGPGGRTRAVVEQERAAIEQWCRTHIGVMLPITAEKDMAMTVFYDDRARQVERDTGRVIGED